MPPTTLVADVRGVVDGGVARIGTLDGGLFFNQIGPNVAGGYDAALAIGAAPNRLVERFRGQLYFLGMSGPSAGTVYVYDEGGTNIWTAGVSAKGGRGTALGSVSPGVFTGLFTVNTSGQDYLVLCKINSGTTIDFWRYDPDTGANGTWSTFNLAVGAPTTTGSYNAIVYKGQLFVLPISGSTAGGRTSFDPVSGGITALSPPAGTTRWFGTPFVLQDRLFAVWVWQTSSAGTLPLEEFVLGAWTTLSAGTEFKSASNAANVTAIPISETKALLFGGGGPGAAAVNGLQCWLVEVTSPAATPTATDVTNAVIPPTLRPGAPAPSDPNSYRVYAMVDNDSNPGTPSYWLYFMPDGGLTTTPATLFQVTDEFTELLNVGSPASDSDFAYSNNFYGGGDRYNGIDGSTRLVTVSPRGYSAGVTGLVVRCSAHGDATVVAHNAVAGPGFTVGETVTGSVSGATGIVIGDGAAEGLYLRTVTGAFQGDDASGGPDTLTGGGSGSTTVADTVLRHTAPVAAGPFEVGQTVQGGTSLATGVVTVLGIAGELVKVDSVAGGPFQIGEVITQTTGPNAGANATLTSAPLGSTGGAADKTIRARYFIGASQTGLGVPISGVCTMVAGSGSGGVVSKGTGPGGTDELINVVADGAVGGDAPVSFEWDFLTDGVPKFLVDNVQFGIDRT